MRMLPARGSNIVAVVCGLLLAGTTVTSTSLNFVSYDETTNLGPSDWQVVNSSLISQTTNIYDGYHCTASQLGSIFYAPVSVADYTWVVSVASVDNDALGIVFRVADTNNLYKYTHTNEGSCSRILFKKKNGVSSELWRTASGTWYTQEYSSRYEFRVEISGCQFVGYYMGTKDFDITDPDCVATGGVGMYTYGNRGGQWSDWNLGAGPASSTATSTASSTTSPHSTTATSTSIHTTTLTTPQLQWFHNPTDCTSGMPLVNYDAAVSFCSCQGGRLATLDEYCPSGGGMAPYGDGGLKSGVEWAAFSGGDHNEWVQVGDSLSQTPCVSHRWDGWGDPAWGVDDQKQSTENNWVLCKIAPPTAAPTVSPTTAPTEAPTAAPSAAPTAAPTVSPTTAPTEAPTSSGNAGAVLAMTTLSAPILAGATTLPVASTDGFAMGDTIRLSGGGYLEDVEIAGFGTILLAWPTAYSYPLGTTITKQAVEAATPVAPSEATEAGKASSTTTTVLFVSLAVVVAAVAGLCLVLAAVRRRRHHKEASDKSSASYDRGDDEVSETKLAKSNSDETGEVKLDESVAV